MASSLLRGDAGQFAAAYADEMTTAVSFTDYAVMGRGVDSGRTIVSQSLVPEVVLGIAVPKVVGNVATGLVNCDGLTVNPRAFVARSIATAALTAGTVTINTAAADPNSFIFVTPYGGGTLTAPLRVTNITNAGFTVTGGATDTADFAWWIVNPNYSS